jgi:hypothetical protein
VLREWLIAASYLLEDKFEEDTLTTGPETVPSLHGPLGA